jgi:hypothetical protein
MPHSGSKVFSGTASSTKAGLADGMGSTVYAINLINNEAAKSYVQIFNLPAASVTVGTTAPLVSIGLPASGGLTLSFPRGWILGGSGFTIASTTTRAGSTTAGVDYNFWV